MPSATHQDFPEFEGRCAFALSIGRTSNTPRGKSDYRLTRNGNRYFFAGGLQKILFRLIPGSLTRAHRNWDASW